VGHSTHSSSAVPAARLALLLVLCTSGLLAPSRRQVPNPTPDEDLRASPSPASGDVAVPKKAKELLLAAARVNGLEGPGIKPWHILVRYEKFDWLGETEQTGAYEEWWIAPNRYRLAYRGPTFTQTEYGTESGVYRTGDPRWPGRLQTQIRDEFVHPVSRELDLQFNDASKLPRDRKKGVLSCVALEPWPARKVGFMIMIYEFDVARICFEPDTLILRASRGVRRRGTDTDEIFYQRTLQFQHRYVAGDVYVAHGGRPFLKLHLEKLEAIERPDPAIVMPPPDAMRIDDKPITPDPAVIQFDYLLQDGRWKFWIDEFPNGIRPPVKDRWLATTDCVPPPDSADSTVRLEGDIWRKFTIDRKGRVTAVEFMFGNREGLEDTEEVMKETVYRPFLLRGAPVEIEVTECAAALQRHY